MSERIVKWDGSRWIPVAGPRDPSKSYSSRGPDAKGREVFKELSPAEMDQRKADERAREDQRSRSRTKTLEERIAALEARLS